MTGISDDRDGPGLWQLQLNSAHSGGTAMFFNHPMDNSRQVTQGEIHLQYSFLHGCDIQEIPQEAVLYFCLVVSAFEHRLYFL